MPRGGGLVSSSRTICQSCMSKRQRSRLFTTTASRSQLPPESPDYVDYPKPELSDITRWEPIKGILPVPRDIFTKYRARNKDNKVDKASDEFALRATADPQRKRNVTTRGMDADAKDRVSELRRRNLREGLKELAARTDRTTEYRARRAQANQAAAQQARDQPPTDAELHTATSVSKELREYLQGKGPALTRPLTEKQVAAKQARYKRLEDKRREARIDDLHTLYLQARYFITNHDDLAKALDAAFDYTDTYDPTVNIFMKEKQLQTTNEMIRDYDNQRFTVGTESARMKTLAEVLTGGRIEKRITELPKQ